ncbi:PAS fold [Yoonia tamlensis]|uniref:PAS fold n=1 Tax=Yoonia tamlensis TaxID=390270 RepID=A0A1I6HHB9_9RHOB|nr:PAS-domain containing protein [Yoonia tamlensis]SFR53700.1 PAS fold [Yoonia tamlensis]
MLIGYYQLAFIGFGAALCLVLAFIAWRTMRQSRQLIEHLETASKDRAVFLFQNSSLIDATPQASALLSNGASGVSELESLVQLLGPHVPNLRHVLENPPATKTRIDGVSADSIWVEICETGGRTRITVNGAAGLGEPTTIAQDVRLSELAMLRDLTQHSPQLIWQEAPDGRLIWANQTYLAFADGLMPTDDQAPKTWPSTSIFPALHETLGTGGADARRLSVKRDNPSAEYWFDVKSTAFGGGFLYYASDANGIVQAEHERQNFKQTLGKTFAELSCGLAVFDKSRRLTTFNPALLDLTGMPFEFLSNRPSLDTVLDRLREQRMLPEPKNYTSWRAQFSAVEEAAKNGSYREIWALPDGQTFRVTGRPHPDGAFAFMFEDISAEVSLERRFRADIETSQAVLDSMPDAIAVFSAAGTLLISNQAYTNLWQTNPSVYHEQRMLQTEIRVWKNHATNAQIWARIRNFVHQTGPRDAFSDTTFLDDGRELQCHANAIAAGKTLIRFTTTAMVKPVIQKLMMHDPAIRAGKR